jgi:hypothetical protein
MAPRLDGGNAGLAQDRLFSLVPHFPSIPKKQVAIDIRMLIGYA